MRFVFSLCLILPPMLPQVALSQALRCQDIFTSPNRSQKAFVINQASQFQKALKAYGENELEEALQWGLTLYRVNPIHYENLLFLGSVAQDMGRFQTAEFFYQKAAALAFQPKLELTYLLDLYEKTGQSQKQIEILEKIVEFEKKTIGLITSTENQIYLWTIEAKLFNRQGLLEQSAQKWQKIIELNSRDAYAHSQMGRLSFLLGKTDLALYHITQAQKIKPREALFFHQKMAALFALQDILAIEQAIEKMGGQAKAFYQSSLHLLKGEFSKALPLLEGEQTSLAFVRLRAQTYFSMGRFDLAYKDLIIILQNTKRTDFFALTALYHIEKGETSFHSFQPSPILEQIIAHLSQGEWTIFLRFKDKVPWIFEADTLMDPQELSIQNRFWSDLGIYTTPINRQAVKSFLKK